MMCLFMYCVCSLVTGNHDLEGMDDFETDIENLHAWMDVFGLQHPYFAKRVSKWVGGWEDRPTTGHGGLVFSYISMIECMLTGWA